MLEDKDVRVRRLRECYQFFKSMAQRRSDWEAAKAATTCRGDRSADSHVRELARACADLPAS